MLIHATKENPSPTIEMTPIVDIVFLLLIFFLVATTFRQEEREMQITLPFAGSSAPISAMLRELIINVDSQSKIIVSGRRVDEATLNGIVKDAVATNPNQKVTVRGDRATPYAGIVRVLDICKIAGIQEPYLDTVLNE